MAKTYKLIGIYHRKHSGCFNGLLKEQGRKDGYNLTYSNVFAKEETSEELQQKVLIRRLTIPGMSIPLRMLPLGRP